MKFVIQEAGCVLKCLYFRLLPFHVRFKTIDKLSAFPVSTSPSYCFSWLYLHAAKIVHLGKYGSDDRTDLMSDVRTKNRYQSRTKSSRIISFSALFHLRQVNLFANTYLSAWPTKFDKIHTLRRTYN